MISARTGSADQLLTVEAAAERLSTSVRLVRRLIAERRIEFVKVGRLRAATWPSSALSSSSSWLAHRTRIRSGQCSTTAALDTLRN